MSSRYLLVVDNGGSDWNTSLDRLVGLTGFKLALRTNRIAALIDRQCRWISIGSSGCVLGSLFPRYGRARPVTALSPEECASIDSTKGRALLHSFWGGYVAAIAAADRIQILRDPSATIPCYCTISAGLTAFASDPDVLIDTGLAKADIDYLELGRHLYEAGLPTPRTALRRVYELMAGFAVKVPGRLDSQESLWSPWNYVIDRNRPFTERIDSISRTVRHCVDSWAFAHDRILLSVSGGLDSSIVAACLAKSGRNVVCLTMFTGDPAGDERGFAVALCDHLGLPLIMRPYRIEDVDITQPLGAHLPRPSDRSHALAFERTHLEVANEIGASAFMSGNGGDSVFGYSQSAAPIVDRYLSQGMAIGVVDTMVDVCRQTGCSMVDAVVSAWRLARRPHRYQCRPNTLFLHSELLSLLSNQEPNHPWFDAPPDAVPGKSAHIGWILRVQQSLQHNRGWHYPLLNPLMSQPIVETCLEIPSWEWRSAGRDRAVARRAFEADLPRAVLNRRAKGSPGPFAAKVLDHFRGTIRNRLLGGRLASHRVIDSVAVEQVLARHRPITDLERIRILELVNTEAWIDRWVGQIQTFEPGKANVN